MDPNTDLEDPSPPNHILNAPQEVLTFGPMQAQQGSNDVVVPYLFQLRLAKKMVDCNDRTKKCISISTRNGRGWLAEISCC